MTTNTGKPRENRLRRMATRRGLVLQKSCRRDPLAFDYGGWQLINERSMLVFGDVAERGFGASLDEIEDFLTSPPGQ